MATSNTVIKPKNYLMWFRRDLRLHDNTAFNQLTKIAKDKTSASLNASKNFKALFVVTPEQWLKHDMSIVQVDFIFRTLKVLAKSLKSQLNIELHILKCQTYNDSIEQIQAFCKLQDISHVVANYEYEINEIQRDDRLQHLLSKQDIRFKRYHDQCIFPPKTVTTGSGDMYKVFTPFYNRWQSILDTSPMSLYEVESLFKPHNNPTLNDHAHEKIIDNIHQQTLKQFATHREFDLNKTNNLKTQLATCCEAYPAGEVAACYRLDQFIAEDIANYDLSRDQPALAATSQLSAYLAIGVISPRLCYLQAKKALDVVHNSGASKDITRWISELAWRDFYRHVIVDRPDIVKGNAFKIDTDNMVKWSYDEDDFTKWRTGNTGVPLVDAAMRCLNQTGFMHNRLRMVTAMFLTKDLLIDWRLGERYFMQQLIDGDFASNNGGWQWSASVGTDAAPYFRIMNPFSQAKTHDKDAIFIKTWLPELKDIPSKILHDELKINKALSANGEFAQVDYPIPMLEHKKARLYAIEQFKAKS